MIQSTKLVKSVLLRSCSEFIFHCWVCWDLLHASHNGKSVTITDTDKANTKFQLNKTTKRTKMLWKLNLCFSLSVPSFLVFSFPFCDFFLLSFFFDQFHQWFFISLNDIYRHLESLHYALLLAYYWLEALPLINFN